MAIEANTILDPVPIRDKESCGQVQPFAPGPDEALRGDRARSIDRGMRLLERLGKEGVILQGPELALHVGGCGGGGRQLRQRMLGERKVPIHERDAPVVDKLLELRRGGRASGALEVGKLDDRHWSTADPWR